METMTNPSAPAYTPEHLRIIDANLNRLNEGIRVVEDLFRYAYNHTELARALKTLRHQAMIPELYDQLLNARNANDDVLRPSQKSELERADQNALFIANFKRAQEAARVLEELLKLYNTSLSEAFKQIRYELYTQEKRGYALLKAATEV